MLNIPASQMASMTDGVLQQQIAQLAARVRNLNPTRYASASDADLCKQTAAQVAQAQQLGITNQRDVARYIDLANKSPEAADPNSAIMKDRSKTPDQRMRMAALKSPTRDPKQPATHTGGRP